VLHIYGVPRNEYFSSNHSMFSHVPAALLETCVISLTLRHRWVLDFYQADLSKQNASLAPALHLFSHYCLQRDF